MFERLKALYKPKAPEQLKITAPPATTLAPIVVIACGAGMAFWWWSQWARSREEARLTAPDGDAPGMGDAPQILDEQVLDALDESLAVQADADQAKARTPPSAAA
jgi:hypothetical protein